MEPVANFPRLNDVRPLQRGLGLVRCLKATVVARGDPVGALAYAQAQWPSETSVHQVLKTAITSGSTTSVAFGSTLVDYRLLAAEFLEQVRARSVFAKMAPNFRKIPFVTKVARTTSGTTVGWVGEGLAKPISEAAFDSVTLGLAKISGVTVISQELMRSSAPSAETVLRDDLAAAIAAFVDSRFLDPQYAAVANVSPASITNGLTPIVSSGASAIQIASDLELVVDQILTNGGQLHNAVWVMKPGAAVKLAAKMSTTGSPAFPTMGVDGGTLLGLPALVTGNAPGSVSGGYSIALIDQSLVLFADDGAVAFDASGEAAIQMDSAPSSSAANVVSLWQGDLLAVRAERIINWKPARATGVAGYLDGLSI